LALVRQISLTSKQFLGRRQLGTVIAAQEQVAVDIHGDRDRRVSHALLHRIACEVIKNNRLFDAPELADELA
jgi:hypothetical protein